MPEKTHNPRTIHLVVDALYFGQRLEDTSWCAVVFRAPKSKENLWWSYAKQETESLYRTGRDYLEKLGYTILSVTGDGFGPIRQAFSGIPFQMCQVHMQRLVVRGTTRHPILEAGKVLLALSSTLPYSNRVVFQERFQKYLAKYRDFLNERSINPLTGSQDYTHRELRRAMMSLYVLLPYLFTFETNLNIPKTTNSLEGHFSHIRDVVEIHRGLSRRQKQKVLDSIFLASTIAPTEKKLDHIL